MNLPKQRYFKIIRMLMSSVGVWPYQSKTSSRFAFFLSFLIAGSQLYFKIAFVRFSWPNPEVLVECMMPILGVIMCLIKLLNLLVNRRKMKIMLDEMISWPCNSKEALIMQTYIRGAEIFALIWACTVYTTSVIMWNALPLLPQMFGTMGNNTRQLPSPAYYHTDIENYYYPVYAHEALAGFFFTTGSLAADTIYVFLVQRACGLFAVLCDKFQNALRSKNEYSDTSLGKCDNETYKRLVDCVELHIKAIKFADLIDSGHKYSFLLTIGLNMLMISSTGAEMINNLNEIHHLLRQSAMIVILMIHLVIENYYAQRLMDHSLMVYDKILESNWYGTSLRTKKLLIFLTARSLKPSVLTIGGIHVMSMQTFCLVLRCSASYFTILLSLR